MAFKKKNKNYTIKDFADALMEQIPIEEFYTKITGLEFKLIDHRLRALVSWKEDENLEPNLTVNKKNQLCDFSVKNGNGFFIIYNHVDIIKNFLKLTNLNEAVKYLCTYANVEFPEDLESN